MEIAKNAKDRESVAQMLRLVWTEADPFMKARLAMAVLLVSAASVSTALGPLTLKWVVDSFTGRIPNHALTFAMSTWALVGLYVLTQWLARSIGEVRALIYARAERRMMRTLSERLFAHVLALPLRFHLNRQTGAICQSLENGTQGYQIILHQIVFTFLPVGAELATTAVVLTRLSHLVFLALFCGAFLCYAGIFMYAARTTSEAAKRASAARIEANATMTDSLLNYETVKYFAAEPIVIERVSQALKQTESEWGSFYYRYALNGITVASVFATFLGLSILYAAREVNTGAMTIGDFVMVNGYMLQVVRPVEMLGYAVQGFSQGLAMLAKMLELFREPVEVVEFPRNTRHAGFHPRYRNEGREAKEGAVSSGEVTFEGVRLSYHTDRPVLKGVSFHVPRGTTLGIVGPSGSGKSTLVRLLARLIEPDSGRILLDGVSINERPLAQLRQLIAVVPQHTDLLHDSIGYNIGIGKAGSTSEEIVAAAKLAHLHEFILTLPARYDTPVGERGVKLSGGERQRVSIARAVLRRPCVYIADEATSSLDSHTESEILRNLMEISRHATMLIIAHRLSTVVHADQIVFLENGVVIEKGTHASLLARRGRYAKLWDIQQRGTSAA